MAKTTLIGSRQTSTQITGDNFAPIGNTFCNPSTTEANAQTKVYVSATLSKLTVHLYLNSTDTTVVYLRKNGANANQLIVIGIGLTGTFSDAVNTDTVVSGDILGVFFDRSGTATYYPAFVTIDFDASSLTTILQSATATSFNTQNTTSYVKPVGASVRDTALDNNNQYPVDVAVTHRNMSASVSLNARTTTTTFTHMVNGAAGTLAVAIGAGLTGFFEDTSNSDSLSAGDTFSYRGVTGSGGTASFTLQNISVNQVTGGSGIHIYSDVNLSLAPTTTRYFYIGGYNFNVTNQATRRIPFNVAGNMKNFRIYVATNTTNGDTAFTLQKNGVDTALAITVPAAGTGAYTIAGPVSFSAGDDWALKITFPTATTGNIDLNYTSLVFDPASGTTYNDSFTESVTAADALTAAVTFVASLTESVAPAHTNAVALTANASVSESVAPADALVPGLVIPVSLTESIAAGDALSVAATLRPTITESITAGDALTPGLVMSASFTETVTAAESLATAATFNATMQDSVALSDSLAVTAIFNAALQETITAVESITNGNVFGELISASVALNSTFQVEVIFNTSLSESISAGDSLAAASIFNELLNETVSVSDGLETYAIFFAEITESVAPDFSAVANSGAPKDTINYRLTGRIVKTIRVSGTRVDRIKPDGKI